MGSYVLRFQDIDKTMVALVGGKGANLGELAAIRGLNVPGGFCLSTAAMQSVMEETPRVHELLDQLALLKVEDRDKIAELSGEMRRAIAARPIPADIRDEITRVLAEFGADQAYAVRSSATAEDLPGASFAGQQDTYLNVVGPAAILAHVSKCWASLFTERAVTYRLQNGFDHRQVLLAVVVQKMVFPQAAGILFTADPVTANRRVLSIDAGFGLGESLVAGLVNPDVYKVRDGKVIEQRIAAKMLAIGAASAGGTQTLAVEPAQQNMPVLADAQILQLARIGRQLEEHFGCPQDIEWCLADDLFYIVQSRPITTLYPIPQADDGGYHVYVSTGHQQMMTDAMKPLGLSFFLLTTLAPMRSAGGRLFVDIARPLAAPASRKTLIDTLGADPLIRDALTTLVEREDFAQLLPEVVQEQGPAQSARVISTAGLRNQVENDPAIVAGLIWTNQASLAELKGAIPARTGVELFDLIREDIQQQLRKILFAPQSSQVILAAMDASAWLNEKMHEWLGEKNAADTLSQSVPDNVTSEMGLALLDVADVIRPFPQVIAYLQQVEEQAGEQTGERGEAPGFLAGLAALEGGQETRAALDAFLGKYGMRGSGEIDITRPRWSETPAALVPILLNHVRTFEPGAARRKFEQGRAAASRKEDELLARLRQAPDGEEKAAETKRMIDLVRMFIGYREYPKYGMVSRYFVYKQALLQEAQRLVDAGVLHEKEDSYYLTFDELREVVRTHQLDPEIIRRRKDEYQVYARLTPPRVITSDGEIMTGAYKRVDLPAAALAGLPVSAGVVEGRARVVLRMEDADLGAGDILVTAFTDPSWTPLFVSIKGLVTEVGGLMTHGAVIAREYGLPAVVGVENATRLIRDGQRIRVSGTDGYVELL